ncbi:hypothetical protein EGW08_002181 [Elysia chlorotica]|uniref:Acyl-ACP thioesterase n=1 Tax=Elysia chlorotica TaxID=188477 RepID=A0A3S1AEX8_ELYCH|nr:hypothetical protein EGW08_002181 [Elysia chlorotica]
MATHVKEYDLVLDSQKLQAESHFPGISYDDFDRGGRISPWKICRMFEAGRAIPFILGDFLDRSRLTSDKAGLFVLGGEYYFDSCLWDATRKYNFFPYKVTLEVINVGQSSLTFRQVLINKLDNKELATFYMKMVLVDLHTKRPIARPQWHQEKFRHLQGSQDDRVKVLLNAKLAVPEGAFQAETLVVPSDTDFNGHTNQASYVRFCLDAAEAANKAGFLQYVDGDICRYPILKISISYKGETTSGDRLFTSVWQDDLSPQVLNFATYRAEKLVLVVSITFKPKPKPRSVAKL